VTVNLAEVISGLNCYLDKFSHRRYYPDNYRPIVFGSLKVVATIQNDETKSVLQAIEADVLQFR
jgi:hypothetical protein